MSVSESVCLLIVLQIMNRLERNNLKVRILRLADLQSTGRPADLAERFGLSIRSVKRYVSEIRDDGYFIRYCPYRQTYVTEKEYI